ncbi:hypothetical protein Q8A67_011051 [Cirrhinus molitorella]|uniref:Uncharacterized protein n=1 Tax=Cirrhinus molitorella TaxID=172907 RepID=A0AA88PU86_9TELE|nr:hypothetical protein Q8A67_011051 [Cirrhinus molitorella]
MCILSEETLIRHNLNCRVKGGEKEEILNWSDLQTPGDPQGASLALLQRFLCLQVVCVFQMCRLITVGPAWQKGNG